MSSKKIDDKVVEMRFDNKDFERNVQTSLSTLEKLKQALHLDGAGKGFEKLEKTSAKCDMSTLSGAIQTVQAKFSAMEVVGMTALANITNSAINTGKQIVKAFTIDPVKSGFQEYETQINAVQTILANTSSKGTTLDQVNEALDELNRYADMTIYNFTEMTRNIGTFTAAGVDLDTSVAAIKGIANLAAVSGSTSQQASTAMYQLSQALAAGTVKLMDWNSVVNAGMGGQVFQDALTETARVHGIAIDQMIKDEGSFRETLQKGWLSSDILTETLQKFTGDLTESQLLEQGYTEKQAKAILEMGRTANDAATKVKTFTQLVDTLKEAAQSGWTESWETIVGDFEESKKLWSGISDALGTMIDASSKARNELLSGGLDSGWSNFLKEGVADAVGFKEAILDAAVRHGVAMEEIITSSEKFEDSLSSGWLSADILSEALSALTQKTAGLSDTELANLGYTRKQIDALENLNASVQDGTADVEEYAKQIARLSGRENLIQSFWNTWNAFFADTEEQTGVITALNQAFRDVFPPTTSEQLYAFTEGLRKFTEKFKMSGETVDKLKRSLKGVFAVADILGSFVKESLGAGFDTLSKISGKADSHVLDMAASIGDAVSAFRDGVKESEIFAKGLGVVSDALYTGVVAVSNFVTGLYELPQVQARIAKFQEIFSAGMSGVIEYFSTGIDVIGQFVERTSALDSISLKNIGIAARDFKENVLGYFVTLGGRFKSFGDVLDAAGSKASGFFTLVQKGFHNFGEAGKLLSERFSDYFSDLFGTFGSMMSKVIEFSDMLREKFGENFGEILTIGIGAGLIFSVKKLSDAMEALAKAFGSVQSVVKNFGGLLKSCSGAVDAFAQKTKSQALINVATSIAILVGSLALLTQLDQDKLLSSLGALGLLATGTVAVCAAMGALEKVGDFKKVSFSIVGISAALLILGTALKKMEKLDSDLVLRNLGILGLLAIGLGTMAAVMSRTVPHLTTGSIFLLSFATSMNVLVGAMKKLEKVDVSKSGKTIPMLAASIAGLVLVTKACGNIKMGSAAGILAISVSLGILAGALKKITEIDVNNANGSLDAFLAIFTSFAAVTAASQFAGKYAAKAGASILAMSAALLLLVPAIKGLGKIDPLDMERASETIAKLLAVFAAVTAVSKFAGEHAAKAGVMMLMMSGAIVILSGVMVMLSHLDPEGLDNAVKAIATVEALFAAVIASTHFAKDAKSTLTLITVSLGLLAVTLGALSMIDPEKLRTASASISLVMGTFALVIASTNLAKSANKTIVVITAAVAAMAGILGLLSSLPLQNVLANATALSELMLALSASMVIIGKAGHISSNALVTIGVMTLVTAAMAGILGVLSHCNVESSLENAASLSLLVTSLSGACLILSGVGAAGSAAFVGVGALATLIAAVGSVMVGLGALNAYFPQMQEFLDTGLALLEKIGHGLGAFAGNIVGGFLAGATSGLPEIGVNLSEFMLGAKPFFDTVKGIDGSAMAGVESMAKAIAVLCGADILNSLTSWITGGASLTTFADQLAAFGAAFAEYAETVGGIQNMDVVSASAGAAKTLAEFAKALPNSGGVLAAIAGDNSMSAFADELAAFGPKFVDYASAVSGITNFDAVTASSAAAKSIAEFAKALPNSGGVLAKWIGDNSLSAFAKELAAFAPKFVEYASAVGGITNIDAVTASSAAAKSIAEFAGALPNSGGFASWITGDNRLSAFAEELAAFGPSFAQYAKDISEITPETVTASASAAQALAALARDIPNSGGLAGFFAGNNDLDEFGMKLVAFGESFKMYCASVSEITNIENVSDSVEGLQALVDLANGAGNGKKLKNFGDFLNGLAETRINEFINAFKDSADDVKKAGESLGKNLESGLRTSTSNLKNVGRDAAQGFINGINSKLSAVSTASFNLGSTAEKSARKALDSHSPSKKFIAIGKDVADGLGIGITSNSDTVKNAISGVVDVAKDGIGKLTSADVDKWIGKVAKAEDAETNAAKSTAKAAEDMNVNEKVSQALMKF